MGKLRKPQRPDPSERGDQHKTSAPDTKTSYLSWFQRGNKDEVHRDEIPIEDSTQPGTARESERQAARTTFLSFLQLPPNALAADSSGTSTVSALGSIIDHHKTHPDLHRSMADTLLTIADRGSSASPHFSAGNMQDLARRLQGMGLGRLMKLHADYTQYRKSTAKLDPFTECQKTLASARSFSLDPSSVAIVDPYIDPSSTRKDCNHLIHMSSRRLTPEEKLGVIKQLQADEAEANRTRAAAGGQPKETQYILTETVNLPPRPDAKDIKSSAAKIWQDVPDNTTHLSRADSRAVRKSLSNLRKTCDTRSAFIKSRPDLAMWFPVTASWVETGYDWASGKVRNLFNKKNGSGSTGPMSWAEKRMGIVNRARANWGGAIADDETWASRYERVIDPVYSTFFGESAARDRKEDNTEQRRYVAETDSTVVMTPKERAKVEDTTATTMTFRSAEPAVEYGIVDRIGDMIESSVRAATTAQEIAEARAKKGEELAKKAAKEATSAADTASAGAE